MLTSIKVFTAKVSTLFHVVKLTKVIYLFISDKIKDYCIEKFNY